MNKIVCYLLLIFLLAGCATITVSTVREYHKIPPDEVLVFGQIDTNIEEGFTIVLKRDGLLKEMQIHISGDGYFYWRLKPGTYIITRYFLGLEGPYIRDPYLKGRIWVTYEVPVSARAVYIGTLHIRKGAISTVRAEDNFDTIYSQHPLQEFQVSIVRVEDNLDTAVEILKKKFSLTEVSVSKSLMMKEKM